MKRFGDFFLECIQRKGWSRTDFADRIGTAQGVISNYTTGKRKPPLKHIEQWIEELGLNEDDADEFRLLAFEAHTPNSVLNKLQKLEERVKEQAVEYQELQNDYIDLQRRVQSLLKDTAPKDG